MRKSVFLKWFVIVFVISIVVFIFVRTYYDGSVDIDALTKCLTEKGFKMYGTGWCSHCQNQKALFGESFQFVDYIDCDQDRQACLDAGVAGYPTWMVDGKSYPGGQSLERLASLSGCEIP